MRCDLGAALEVGLPQRTMLDADGDADDGTDGDGARCHTRGFQYFRFNGQIRETTHPGPSALIQPQATLWRGLHPVRGPWYGRVVAR